MKRLLLLLMFIMAFASPSDASDHLAFDTQEGTDATTYNLQLSQGDHVRTIWSKRVALINGEKPYDWCRLLAWESNKDGLLALVESNEFWGRLLQFNSNGALVAELETGGSWLFSIRNGGSIKLEPFDKIEVTGPDGSITKFLIRNGRLADQDGRVFEQPLPIQIGEKSFATKPASVPIPLEVPSPTLKAPEIVSTASTLVEESTASTSRPVVTAETQFSPGFPIVPVAIVVVVIVGIVFYLLQPKIDVKLAANASPLSRQHAFVPG
ncbi:MAG: hypothetical protein HC901_00580 [Bdellovibrionaceae bacterium]|nr:hypothetical protein [Pseudobdellovibrionaceae bacterium]